MRRKSILTAALSLFLGLSAIAGTVQSITVNGEIVEKVVTRLTFDGNNVVLHFNDNTTLSTDMEGVSITFSEVDEQGCPTSIDALQTFSYKGLVGNLMQIGNLAEGTTINIFNASGARVLTTRAQKDVTTLNVEQLRSGVYMLQAGRQIVKFVKKD